MSLVPIGPTPPGRPVCAPGPLSSHWTAGHPCWEKICHGPHSWIRQLFARPVTRPIRKAPARCRPALEALEDRALPAVTFNPAVNHGAGSVPFSLTVGDFNRDGRQDLAVANNGSDTVSVLLGQGDGSFHSAVHYAAGFSPASVAVGDFNGDGKQDLAVANSLSDNVSVLLGQGDGSFQSAVPFAAGDAPRSVAVGDFNGDGKPDLAVAKGNSETVSVLLGQGGGSFNGDAYFDGWRPSCRAVGEVNRAGAADLVVTD